MENRDVHIFWNQNYVFYFYRGIWRRIHQGFSRLYQTSVFLQKRAIQAEIFYWNDDCFRACWTGSYDCHKRIGVYPFWSFYAGFGFCDRLCRR